LERGEDPCNIRLIDLNEPTNHAVKDALLKGVQFVWVDITDAAAVEAAFEAPWPKSTTESSIMSGRIEPAITVFHTAANIRFFERHPEFYERSTRVNVGGTQNVINAARKVGVDIMVYTSSGSVCLHNLRLFFWPWEKEAAKLVQIVNDDDTLLPKRHEDFFSNYAASKLQGEALVRSSDGLPTGDTSNKVLRTGCVRPGNAIFGPRGDLNCGAFLVKKFNPTWASSVVQSFTYVENCVAAHLCYEARLIELQAGSSNPDIGGQAFVIADPGPPPMYGDMYTIMETLTDGECSFPHVSPTVMMTLAHLLEWYYRTQQSLVRKGSKFAFLMPALKGDILNLQPSIFPLVLVRLIFDDSKARLPPEKGGLGYKGTWTSPEGLYRTIEEHKSGVGSSNRRSDEAGFSLFSLQGRKTTVKVTKTALTGGLADSMPMVTPSEVSNPQ
jgi:nucleoside-diphosphate-sugar epimerase